MPGFARSLSYDAPEDSVGDGCTTYICLALGFALLLVIVQLLAGAV